MLSTPIPPVTIGLKEIIFSTKNLKMIYVSRILFYNSIMCPPFSYILVAPPPSRTVVGAVTTRTLPCPAILNQPLHCPARLSEELQ